MRSKAARRGCRHYARTFLHHRIDPKETLIIDPKDGDIDVSLIPRMVILISVLPSRYSVQMGRVPRGRRGVVLLFPGSLWFWCDTCRTWEWEPINWWLTSAIMLVWLRRAGRNRQGLVVVIVGTCILLAHASCLTGSDECAMTHRKHNMNRNHCGNLLSHQRD